MKCRLLARSGRGGGEVWVQGGTREAISLNGRTSFFEMLVRYFIITGGSAGGFFDL